MIFYGNQYRSASRMDPVAADGAQKDQAFFSNIMVAYYGKTAQKDRIPKKIFQK